MMRPIDPRNVKTLIHQPGEVAFLDVREHGQYGEGHPFLAAPCPYSRLEATVGALAPRAGAPVILIDDGDGVAAKAARRLEAMGYRDVHCIDGGAPAWAAAGFTLFKGVNLPSKTLGELIEETWRVPVVKTDQFADWIAEKRAFHLFDGRPAAEHFKMTIPHSRCMPNGELAHRLDDLIADEQTPIVIHCAGRTRSIIGAAGLLLAGVKNPIYALENGTQGWALSGRALDHGASAETIAAMLGAAAERSAARGAMLAERYGIPWIDLATLDAMAADPARTLYLFDIRTRGEFEAGSHPDATHAPGGQLVQATDQWIGVRGARVVLVDDTGLRATLAALWLRQLGYDVFVLPRIDATKAARLVRADAPAAPELPSLPNLSAREALARHEAGGALIDLRSSTTYRRAHLASALWRMRPRLTRADFRADAPVLLVGDEEAAALAALDLRELGAADIAWVEGDVAAWRTQGLPIVATPDSPADDDAIDFLFFVHDRHDGNLESARRYLAWETGLIRQLDADERASFRLDPAPFIRSL